MKFLDNYFNRKIFSRYHVEYEEFPRINGRIMMRRDATGRIRIGKNVRINSGYEANPVGGLRTALMSMAEGIIEIGSHTGISNTGIFARTSVTIGEYVYIGAGCNIYDSNFHSIYHTERINRNSGVKTAPVRIGDRVFIGAHCIILKGVTIGADSVIAAGSVLVKSVPEKEIWGGNPARFISKIPELIKEDEVKNAN